MSAEHPSGPAEGAPAETLAERGFAAARAQLEGQPAEKVFRHIHRTNLWGDPESRSGPGSTLVATEAIRRTLPGLFRRHGIRRLLDVPCGEYGWVDHVVDGLDEYLGGDLVPEIIDLNRHRTAGREDRLRFRVLNLESDSLPDADALLCRDCLVHLPLASVLGVLRRIAASRVPWLITTTFPRHPVNREILLGDWRPLNLEAPPFRLPPPLELLDEQCGEAGGEYRDKSLGVWRVSSLAGVLGS